jgi:hypothetical protein
VLAVALAPAEVGVSVSLTNVESLLTIVDVRISNIVASADVVFQDVMAMGSAPTGDTEHARANSAVRQSQRIDRPTAPTVS